MMTTDEAWARQEIIDTALAMSQEGLSPGRSGNVSRRWMEAMLITPSGMATESLLPEDVVLVDLDGIILGGTRKPSSEWHLHAAIYQARPDLGAITHCHSRHATALACLRRSIPAFHYMVAVAGGRDIRCSDYATFGTEGLAKAALPALEGRRACLLANHGQVAAGRDLSAALDLAREVEALAAQYCTVLSVGEAVLLDDAEVDEVLSRFADYGQPRTS